MYFYILILCVNTITSRINTNAFFDFLELVSQCQMDGARRRTTTCTSNIGQIRHSKEIERKQTRSSGKNECQCSLATFKKNESKIASGIRRGRFIHVAIRRVREIDIYCTCRWYSLCNFPYRQHYENTCSYNFEG
jgi:hypothetical protein